ncbi:hypothetical protein GQR58_000498 [Nymphon striatum]|nr:hypothetical protein GQR58_000498 [Nymphon striatum]
MRSAHVSCLCVVNDDTLSGILTTRDLSGKIVAGDLPSSTPVAQIMTENPFSLPPNAIGSDVLHAMMERHIGHIPDHAEQNLGRDRHANGPDTLSSGKQRRTGTRNRRSQRCVRNGAYHGLDPTLVGAIGRQRKPPRCDHQIDHRYRRHSDAAIVNFGRVPPRATAGSLSLARMRVSGSTRTNRCQRPRQLHDPR